MSFLAGILNMFSHGKATPVPDPVQPTESVLHKQLLVAFKAVAPHMSAIDAAEWAVAAETPMNRENITSVNRIALFMAHAAVESWYFTKLAEDLNYTNAERIYSVFRTHFASYADASSYVNNPEKLANHVYANRYGNGNELSGDGWKFRGRGCIGITFRGNYIPFAKYCGKTLDEAVSYLDTKEGAIAAAVWYWSTKNLNPLADTWQISASTRIITGGDNGISDRIKLANACQLALNSM